MKETTVDHAQNPRALGRNITAAHPFLGFAACFLFACLSTGPLLCSTLPLARLIEDGGSTDFFDLQTAFDTAEAASGFVEIRVRAENGADDSTFIDAGLTLNLLAGDDVKITGGWKDDFSARLHSTAVSQISGTFVPIGTGLTVTVAWSSP